jgi:nucleotide-binding universal stress UspA family protein
VYRRILVPLDRSRAAEVILSHLGTLATPRIEEVILVTVVPPGGTGEPPGGADLVARSRTYLTIVANRLAHQGLPARPMVRLGEAVPSLLALARDHREDAILAMALPGKAGQADGIEASITRQVFRLSPIPVFTVRSIPPHVRHGGPVRSILLATDGSERSLAAFPPALEMATAHGATVRLIYVLPRTPGRGRRRPSGSVRADTLARDWMKKLADPFEKEGVAVRLSVDRGDPAASILGSLRSQPVDLIVMATHGETGPTGPDLGSVTERVLAGSRVPLLIVSAPAISKRRVGPALEDFRAAGLPAQEEVTLGRAARAPVGRRPTWS